MPFISATGGAFGYGRAAKSGAIIEFNYSDFSSTTGLVQVGASSVISNLLYLTQAVTSSIGNVYRTTAIQYNRNFSFEWNFECSGGTSPPADGFCLQWTTTNNTNGALGGGVGYVNTAVNALLFKTFTNNSFTWLNNDVTQVTQTGQNFYRNLFYWVDYNHATSTMLVYFGTTNVKPNLPNFTLNGFSFGATSYYIGFGAATGGSTENHILRSMKLTFT